MDERGRSRNTLIPTKTVSQRWELNPRPLAYEASALPLSYVGRLLSSWNPAPHFLGVKCDVCRIASKLKYLFGWLCATGFLPRAYGVWCTYLLTMYKWRGIHCWMRWRDISSSHHSLVVEHSLSKREVVGSIPTDGWLLLPTLHCLMEGWGGTFYWASGVTFDLKTSL